MNLCLHKERDYLEDALMSPANSQEADWLVPRPLSYEWITELRACASDVEPRLDALWDVGEGVEGFLQLHHSLVELINEAVPQFSRYFGAKATLSLELCVDPDSDSPTLFGIVNTPLNPAAALDALDRFDDAWWLEASSRGKGALQFSVNHIQ